jgi:glycosyltransferase 2 family protein
LYQRVYDRFFVTHFLRGLVDALAHARLWLVAAAIALHSIGLVITGERWRIVIAALGFRLPLARTILINLAGIFVRNTTPTTGLGGDASRIALLGADGVPLVPATASFAYVRLAEVPPLAAIVLLSTPVALTLATRSRAVMVAAIAAVAAVAALVWLKRSIVRARVRDLWQRTQHIRIGWAAMGAAIGYASLAQIETIARQIVIAAAFGLPLTAQQAAAVTVMGIAGGFVPTVGSVGAIDGSLVAGLMMCGATAGTAVAITIVERAISYGMTTAAGGGALAWLGGRGVLRAFSARRTNTATAG